LAWLSVTFLADIIQTSGSRLRSARHAVIQASCSRWQPPTYPRSKTWSVPFCFTSFWALYWRYRTSPGNVARSISSRWHPLNHQCS